MYEYNNSQTYNYMTRLQDFQGQLILYEGIFN